MPMKKLLKSLSLMAMLASMQVNAAQPDAGQIIKEIELNQPKVLKDKMLIELNKPIIEEQDIPKIEIKKFYLINNKEISSDEILTYLDKFVGKQVTLNGLNDIVNELTNYYRELGLLAQASLPDQDITEGNVLINITEANFAGVEVVNVDGEESQIDPKYVKQFFESQGLNRTLSLQVVDRKLLIFNRNHGIEAKSSLAAGDYEGDSKVLIQLENLPRFESVFSMDNYGSRTTGRTRGIYSLDINNPVGIGDQIQGIYMKTQGVDFVSMGYDVPIGYDGLRANLSVGYMEYEVIHGEYEDNDLQGDSLSYRGKLSYPIKISPQGFMDVVAQYDKKFFTNEQGSTTLSNYNSDVIKLGIEGSYTDYLILDGAFNDYEIYLHGGNVDYRGSNYDGSFTKITFDYERLQYIDSYWSASLKLSGQYANHNMDSSEKFYLGGPGGVRAYPTSEGGGTQGILSTFEIARSLPYALEAKAFFDMGAIKQLKDRYSGDNVTNNSYNLKGYGAGLEWNGPNDSFLGISWSHRIGGNPNKQSDGSDQDGGHKENFIWLNGYISF
jgi:hemolysin activation/secretion protein